MVVVDRNFEVDFAFQVDFVFQFLDYVPQSLDFEDFLQFLLRLKHKMRK